MATIRCKQTTFSNIQAIAFDKDGTLANSAAFLHKLGLLRSHLIDLQIPGIQSSLLRAFGQDESTVNPTGLMAVGSRQENEIAAAAYVAETGQDWIEALQIVRSAFAKADEMMPRKADFTPAFEGAIAFLDRVQQAGLKQSILSSDSTSNVEAFVERYELSSYFCWVMGSDRGASKPDPLLITWMCQTLDIASTSILLIGDSQADIQLAQNSKIAGCVAVTWSGAEPSKLQGATEWINSFNEVEIFPD